MDKKMYGKLKDYAERWPALYKIIGNNLVYSINPAHRNFINLHTDYMYWTDYEACIKKDEESCSNYFDHY
jgi:hypothetical protein